LHHSSIRACYSVLVYHRSVLETMLEDRCCPEANELCAQLCCEQGHTPAGFSLASYHMGDSTTLFLAAIRARICEFRIPWSRHLHPGVIVTLLGGSIGGSRRTSTRAISKSGEVCEGVSRAVRLRRGKNGDAAGDSLPPGSLFLFSLDSMDCGRCFKVGRRFIASILEFSASFIEAAVARHR